MAAFGRLTVVMLALAGLAAADLRGGGGRRRSSPTPGQKRRIKVVTDMGFDDWGAFASLHAAGMDPEAILATNGMMKPTEFYLTFKHFLWTWGVHSPVYQGTEHCFEPHHCLNTSFIDGWKYRPNIRSFFQSPMPAVPEVSMPDAEFWETGGCDENYTLLVLSPASDVALAVSQNPFIARCIEEIVLAGGVFNASALQQYDNVTWEALMTVDPQGEVPADYYAQPFRNAELNIAADAPAADYILGLGVPITIVPLEVDSIARPGLQKLLADGEQPADQDDGSEWRGEVFFQNQFLMQGLCNGGQPRRPSMLQHMACISKGEGDVHTLDMDAITSAYLWSEELFDVEPKNVKVNRTTGVTSLSDSCSGTPGECREVRIATSFNATAWVQKLRSMV